MAILAVPTIAIYALVRSGMGDVGIAVLLLWLNIATLGFYRAVARAMLGLQFSATDIFWPLGHAEDWVLAAISAAVGSTILILSGHPPFAPGGHSAIQMFRNHPYALVEVLLTGFLGVFFQYIFALHAGQGIPSRTALTASLRIFRDRLIWLFFPWLLAFLLFTAALAGSVAASLAGGAVIAISKGSVLAYTGKVLAGLVMLLTFLVGSSAAAIWYAACILMAGSALAPRPNPDFLPEKHA